MVRLGEGEQGGCCRAPSALSGTLPTPKFLQGCMWVLFTSPASSPSEERGTSEVSAPCTGADGFMPERPIAARMGGQLGNT